jgi:hypothetical protein
MSPTIIWLQMYAVSRQVGDDHVTAIRQANEADEVCKGFAS